MSKYEDDDDDVSPWESAFSDAVREYLDKAGCSGLEWDDIDKDLLAEAEREAMKVVGPNPDK